MECEKAGMWKSHYKSGSRGRWIEAQLLGWLLPTLRVGLLSSVKLLETPEVHLLGDSKTCQVDNEE